MHSYKPPGVIGKRVTITLVDGSVIKGCWYQHDGSFVIGNPYIQCEGRDTVLWVSGRYVASWSHEEIEVPAHIF